jgi:hypothetical protein
MNTKLVSYTFDTMPELTEAEVERLKELAARPDSGIDYSDIPQLTDEQWKNAKRRGLVRTAATRASTAPAAKEESARPA